MIAMPRVKPLLAVTLVLASAALVAQTSGITRAVVARADVSVPGREAVVARVEVAAGGAAGRHTHPGDEIRHVVDGIATLLTAGQPPRNVESGEAFVIPTGVPHDARNDSGAPIRLVGVYVVEKGEPLATPASAPAP